MLCVINVCEAHEKDDAEEEDTDERSKPTEYFFANLLNAFFFSASFIKIREKFFHEIPIRCDFNMIISSKKINLCIEL